MRLYFDECCSRRMARELKEFFSSDYPDLETAHVLDSYDQGAHDRKWLQVLQDDRSWIVITQDHGKDPKKEKLPVICQQLGITHVAFSPIIIKSGYSIQKMALVTVWPQLYELSRLPKGTHVRLTMIQGKGGVPRYVLTVGSKPLSAALPPE